MTVPEQRGLHRDDDGRSESRVWGIVGALLVLTAVISLIVIAVQQGKIVDQTTEMNNRSRECTTAGNPCYDNARNQEKLIQAMQARINVVTAWCLRTSSSTASPADLSNCVVDELSKYKAPPSPLP